jgi:hypothetical protein
VDTTDQVVFVLQLVLTLGPLAAYFLCLGLVNSQAHPCMIPARTDFVVLAVAVIPMVMGPVLALVEFGGWWPAVVAGFVVLGFIMMMLPRGNSGWVVYNASLPQCRRLLSRACLRLGLTVDAGEDHVDVPEAGLTVNLSSLPILRNVTLSLKGAAAENTDGRQLIQRLIGELEREIGRETMLPSPAGASMVVIGAAMLAVPMWYLCHNVDAIARAVRQIFFA